MAKKNKTDVRPRPLTIPLSDPSFLREYQIVMVGDGGVGKTNVTNQFVHSAFTPEYDPTIEDAYRRMVSVDEKRMILEVLDTAGQKEFTAMRAQSIKTGEGFIGIYAVDSPSSFESIRELYRHIQDVKSGSYEASAKINRDKKFGRGRSEDSSIPFVLVANKCDLDPKLKKISTAQGIALSQELQCPFIESSAKFGMNTNHIFETVVREIKKSRQASFDKAPLTPPPTPTLSLPPHQRDDDERRAMKRDCCIM